MSGSGPRLAIALAAALVASAPTAAHAQGGVPGPMPSDQWTRKGRVAAREAFSLRADALTYVQVGRRLIDTSNKIIGGDPAPGGAYPWLVSIGLAGVPQTLGHFCAGALIAPSWVLTAAQCLRDVTALDQIQVKLGTSVLSQGESIAKVKRSLVHPKWDVLSYGNDIALLELDAPAEGTATARLLEPDRAGELLPEAVLAMAAGWGYTRDNKTMVSQTLRHLSVQVVPNALCNGAPSYPGQISDEMVCAGFVEGGRDACQVDSGGPLLAADKAGGYVLAGIASWGRGCAQQNLYGVYTRVAPYAAWIAESMAAKGPPPALKPGTVPPAASKTAPEQPARKPAEEPPADDASNAKNDAPDAKDKEPPADTTDVPFPDVPPPEPAP